MTALEGGGGGGATHPVTCTTEKLTSSKLTSSKLTSCKLTSCKQISIGTNKQKNMRTGLGVFCRKGVVKTSFLLWFFLLFKYCVINCSAWLGFLCLSVCFFLCQFVML